MHDSQNYNLKLFSIITLLSSSRHNIGKIYFFREAYTQLLFNPFFIIDLFGLTEGFAKLQAIVIPYSDAGSPNPNTAFK